MAMVQGTMSKQTLWRIIRSEIVKIGVRLNMSAHLTFFFGVFILKLKEQEIFDLLELEFQDSLVGIVHKIS